MSTTALLQRTSATLLELQRVLNDVEQEPGRAWLAEQDALITENPWARYGQTRPMFEVLDQPGDGWDAARWPEPFSRAGMVEGPVHVVSYELRAPAALLELYATLLRPRRQEMSLYEAFRVRMPAPTFSWSVLDEVPPAPMRRARRYFVDEWVSASTWRSARRDGDDPPPVEEIALPSRPDTEHLHFGRWTDPRAADVTFPRLPGAAALGEAPPTAGPPRHRR